MRVNVVNVEAFVTDRQGRPVTDLTAADFEVEEDGQPVTLTNFFAGRKPEAAPAGVAPATEPPPAQPGRTEGPQLDEEQRLNLVVFVDNGNISGSGGRPCSSSSAGSSGRGRDPATGSVSSASTAGSRRVRRSPSSRRWLSPPSTGWRKRAPKAP